MKRKETKTPIILRTPYPTPEQIANDLGLTKKEIKRLEKMVDKMLKEFQLLRRKETKIPVVIRTPYPTLEQIAKDFGLTKKERERVEKAVGKALKKILSSKKRK